MTEEANPLWPREGDNPEDYSIRDIRDYLMSEWELASDAPEEIPYPSDMESCTCEECLHWTRFLRFYHDNC